MRRRRLERDRHLRCPSSTTRASSSIGVEAGGEALEPGRHGAPLTVGRTPGRAARLAVGRAAGRDGPDPRGALDLGRPGLSGQRARARAPARHRARAATWPSATPRRWRPSGASRGWRGSSPRWRPRTRCTTRWRPPTPSSTSCAARAAATRTWPRSSGRHDRPGAEAIAAAFAGDGRRAALMPYMMGGFPDMDTSRRIGEAYADGGADLVELGVPFSDPLADGPVIHAAGHRRAARGSDDPRGARRRARAGRARAGGGHDLREPRDGAGPRALRRRPRGARPLRADRARPAAGGERRRARGVRRLRPGAGPAGGADHADERMARIGASARGFLYAVSVAGTTGERAALADAYRGHRRRGPRHRPRSRSRSASASARPSRRARPPTRAPTASSSAAGSCARRPRRRTLRPPCTSWWRSSRRP